MTILSRRVIVLCGALALAAGGRNARASVADLFGLGGAESGLGGASAARVRDFSAGYYNPAGLVRLERFEASLGVMGFGSQLTIGSQNYAIQQPFGITIGLATPVPLRGIFKRRLFVGLAVYTLPRDVAHVVAHPPDQPFFPYYDNRSQRLLLLPTVAVRLAAGFSLGVAVNFLAGIDGQLIASEGATRAIEARVDQQARTVLRANAGVLWQSPSDRWALAAVYRQSFSLPFATRSSAIIAGQQVDIDASAEGLYTPHQLAIGALVRALPWLALSADFTASFWSAWSGPYVRVASTLPLAGTIAATPPKLSFNDTFSLRLGAELQRNVSRSHQIAARLGVGGESSPIPASQPGVTNLLDGEKIFLAAGLGWRAQLGGVALRVDGWGQMHFVRSRTLTKVIAPSGSQPDAAQALRDEAQGDAPPWSSNPGYPQISGGGFVWAAGLSLTVER